MGESTNRRLLAGYPAAAGDVEASHSDKEITTKQ